MFGCVLQRNWSPMDDKLKFMFSKKATKIDEIFTVDLILCSKCQIDGEDFINFCGFLRKHELNNYARAATATLGDKGLPRGWPRACHTKN